MFFFELDGRLILFFTPVITVCIIKIIETLKKRYESEYFTCIKDIIVYGLVAIALGEVLYCILAVFFLTVFNLIENLVPYDIWEFFYYNGKFISEILQSCSGIFLAIYLYNVIDVGNRYKIRENELTDYENRILNKMLRNKNVFPAPEEWRREFRIKNWIISKRKPEDIYK